MTDRARLIEVAFPLKRALLDSVHEKHVRHGHTSTLHILARPPAPGGLPRRAHRHPLAGSWHARGAQGSL